MTAEVLEIMVDANNYDDATGRPNLVAHVAAKYPNTTFHLWGFETEVLTQSDGRRVRKAIFVSSDKLTNKPFFKAEVWTVDPKAKVEHLDALARKEGKRVVHTEHDSATVAQLDWHTESIRDRFADLLGCKPWELELLVLWAFDPELKAGRIDRVVIGRAPARSVKSEQREAIWQSLTTTLEGEWRVRENPAVGSVVLSFYEDPLRDVVLYKNFVEAHPEIKPTLYRIPYAIDDEGSVVFLTVIESNGLIGGIPGGGKSGGETVLVTGLAQLPNVALVGLDPKLVELPIWKDRFSAIAVENVEEGTNHHASYILAALNREMGRRYTWLSEHGFKKFTADMINEDFPLIVTVIDELADLVSVGSTTEERWHEASRSTAIRRLIAKGRAAGMPVFAATQKPQSDVIPTAMRDLVQQRVAYSTTTTDMTDTILGGGMSKNGGLAHEIAADQKGVCYIINETSRTPRRARTLWIPDEDVEDLAAEFAHLKVELPWLPTASEAEAAALKVDPKGGVSWRDVLPPADPYSPTQKSQHGERIIFPAPDQSIYNLWDQQYVPPVVPVAVEPSNPDLADQAADFQFGALDDDEEVAS
jgi:hypothetical protein